MNLLLGKVKGKNEPFYKVMSHERTFFNIPDLSETCTFIPGYKLEEEEWFKIENFSKSTYSNELTNGLFNSTNYDQLPTSLYQKIIYFCTKQDEYLCFQTTSPSHLLRKKWFKIDAPKLEENTPIIILNSYLDALYNSTSDTLFFKEFSKIKTIFNGIEDLYREATQPEIDEFLSKDFIELKNGFLANNIKTANRKRITFALDIIKQLSAEDQISIFNYISNYCTNIPTQNNHFQIDNEEDLKKILYGIEQRYYTTKIGNLKKLANSVRDII